MQGAEVRRPFLVDAGQFLGTWFIWVDCEADLV